MSIEGSRSNPYFDIECSAASKDLVETSNGVRLAAGDVERALAFGDGRSGEAVGA